MVQLIEKGILLAEIKKLKGKVDDESSYCNGWQQALRMLEMELDTLEVKEEPISNSLEQAAKIYTISLVLNEIIPDATVKQLREVADKSFKAGAQWQKEQIMGTAIKGIARPLDYEVWCDRDEFPQNIQDGDKVKLIIFKEG